MKKTAQNIVLLISALLIAIASTGFWQKSSCCTVSEEMSCCSPEDACEMPDESSSEGETEEDCCSLQATFDYADIKYKVEQSEKTSPKINLDDVFLFPIKILLSVQLFLTFPEEYSSHSPHAPPHLAFSGREILLKKSVLRI